MKYIRYSVIDSTNNEAKRLIGSGLIKENTCLSADVQSAGRGRQGKSFFSPDTGLYMTAVFPVDCKISSQVTMTARAACAVAEAIEKCTDRKVRIKWVNDIYYLGKKCCGILCEAVNDYEAGRMKYVIAGIGINIYNSEWPDEIKDIAGSLYPDKSGIDLDNIRGKLITEISSELEKWLFAKPKEEFLAFYKAYSNVLGEDIVFTENGITKKGKAVDIDENGGLVVSAFEGKEEMITVLNSGEISLRTVSQDSV